MNHWLAQLLSALGGQALAARNSDERDTGWVQILVFVILSVFYAVGSIVKARANKAAPKDKQTPSKPVRKTPELGIDLQMLKRLFGLPEEPESGNQPQVTKPQAAEPQVQLPHRKVTRPATARSAVTSPQPAGMAMLEPQVAKPQVQPKLEKITAGVAAPLVSAERPAARAEIPQTKYLSEILSDYENPESLRRAILHYEILGKPLSLRDPSEHIIGL
jgi:hypothetical protein